SGSAQGIAVEVSSSCQDLTGNSASDARSFMIDSVAPSTALSISPASPNGSNGWDTGSQPVVTLTPPDATSGVAATSYKVNAGLSQTYAAPFSLPDGGSDVVDFSSTDNAGNAETTHTSATYKVDTVNPAITCAVAAPGPNFQLGAAGQQVNATASDLTS